MFRRTHLGVEAVGFVELALTGRVVAEEEGELRRDLVNDGRSRARSDLVDQRGRFREGAPNLGCANRSLHAEQGSGACQERVHLEEAATALPRVGESLIRQPERGPRIALTECRLCQEAKRPRGESEADAALSTERQRTPLGLLGRSPLPVG